MTLEFPNRMCSIDENSGTIRFSGHDGMKEVRFTMQLTTLKKLTGDTHDDKDAYLPAFDKLRSRIQDVAIGTYNHSKKSFYILDISQF